MFDDRGYPANFVELMHAMGNQPGCEQNKQYTCHLEEASQIKSDSSGKKSPAKQSGSAYSQNGTDQGLDNIVRNSILITSEKRGGNKKRQLDPFADNCDKRQPENSTFTGRCYGLVHAGFKFTS